MFSLTSLKCFAAAAEELNFTRAAKRLFISQQALSSHISKLEEYYGVRLFDRGIPMTLTDAGRALQKHAREILSSVDDYAREVQDIKNFRQGELTVGIPVTRGTIMLPPLLSAFHQLFPQIRLHLVEGTVSGNIADALYDGTADLCIGYQPENTEELAVTPLFEEKFVVLVPDRLMKEHHLDRKLGEGALSMDRFAELPFVVPGPVAAVAGVLAGIGAVGILFTAGRESRNPVKRFLKGLYGLYGVSSYLSDILSYSRLLALGLATSVISTVFNQLGAMLGGGVVGAIFFAVVFLIGHSMNMAINLLGAYVHTNRLQFVEFFGKFYEGGGRAYAPFAANTKQFQIKEEK